MGLIETLLLGSYLYTSALWRWCYKLYYNHYIGLEKRVAALEDRNGKSDE